MKRRKGKGAPRAGSGAGGWDNMQGWDDGCGGGGAGAGGTGIRAPTGFTGPEIAEAAVDDGMSTRGGGGGAKGGIPARLPSSLRFGRAMPAKWEVAASRLNVAEANGDDPGSDVTNLFRTTGTPTDGVQNITPQSPPAHHLMALTHQLTAFEKQNKELYKAIARRVVKAFLDDWETALKQKQAALDKRRHELAAAAAAAAATAATAGTNQFGAPVGSRLQLEPAFSGVAHVGDGIESDAFSVAALTDNPEVEAKWLRSVESVYDAGGSMLESVRGIVTRAAAGLPGEQHYRMLGRVQNTIVIDMKDHHLKQDDVMNDMRFAYMAAELAPNGMLSCCLICMFFRWANMLDNLPQLPAGAGAGAAADTGDDSSSDDDSDGDSDGGGGGGRHRRRRGVGGDSDLPSDNAGAGAGAGTKPGQHRPGLTGFNIDGMPAGSVSHTSDAAEMNMRRDMLRTRDAIKGAWDLEDNADIVLAQTSVVLIVNTQLAPKLLNSTQPLWVALRRRCGDDVFFIDSFAANSHMRKHMSVDSTVLSRVLLADAALLPLDAEGILGTRDPVTDRVRLSHDGIKTLGAIHGMIGRIATGMKTAKNDTEKAKVATITAETRRLEAEARLLVAQSKATNGGAGTSKLDALRASLAQRGTRPPPRRAAADSPAPTSERKRRSKNDQTSKPKSKSKSKSKPTKRAKTEHPGFDDSRIAARATRR